MTDPARLVDPTRQGVVASHEVSHEPEPDPIGQAAPLSLEAALAIVDGWPPGHTPFRLHQVCRVLREAYRQADDECNDLRRTFDLRWAADMRAIERWQAAHPGNDLMWPDHADMVVWLLHANDCWQKFLGRLDAEIPCTRGETECGLHDYPWAPCCKLRAAAWFGDPIPTNYLPDEGMIHLFAPVDPACPEAPRRSAGCVKLIQPMMMEFASELATEDCGDA